MAPRPHLVLASSSTYRAELLARLALPFDVVRPDIDETPDADELPGELVMRLAARKAGAVAETHPDALIIASDQVATVDGGILGKPGDRERAIEQLALLSGQWVFMYTSVHVQLGSAGAVESELDITEVHFRSLSRREIERYVDIDQPFDCAGAFKSERLGVALFEEIKTTDPNALIGLPLIRLCTLLLRLGYPVLAAD